MEALAVAMPDVAEIEDNPAVAKADEETTEEIDDIRHLSYVLATCTSTDIVFIE